ncbi:daptide biosynthesis intramembrane metalloprotease [Streptomyces sp. NPDC006463]|uniref:daptide biosynthesis intramembrane metalloprotease n=1 Tax=Streptomyces sp. NPDC006463 TaxID=3364746 RepID=UPI0036C476CE
MAVKAPEREIPGRPQLRPDLEFLPPEEGGRAWTVADEQQRRFTRLGGSATELLRSLDGTRDVQQVRRDLGTVIDERQFDLVIRKFTDLGLLVGTDSPPATQSRFRFQPPASLQFTVLDRPALLSPGRLLPRLMANRATAAGCFLAILAGLVSVSLGTTEAAKAAWQPVPWHYWLIAVVAVIAVNGVHEFAHGAVLARFGGRPHRIGAMLFYGAPAMFCDVTDLWRLRSRRQRVLVALAGVICQLAAAGLFAVGSAIWGGEPGRVLGLCALMTAFTGILNLLPFIRLDGYIALMAWTNIPNLRDKSMADCRSVISWLLFGGPHPRRQLADGWAVFGAVCMIYPWVLIANLLVVARATLLGYGPMGALTWLSLLAFVAGWVLHRLIRMYGSANAHTPLRALATLGLLAAGAIALAQSQPYTEKAYGAYVTSGSRTDVMFPDAPGVLQPVGGGSVQLMAGGILGNRLVGSATTGSGGGRGKADLELFLPLEGVPGMLDVRTYRLDSVTLRGGAPARGVAVAPAGDTTWLGHITRTAIGDPCHMISPWFRQAASFGSGR